MEIEPKGPELEWDLLDILETVQPHEGVLQVLLVQFPLGFLLLGYFVDVFWLF